MLAHYRSFPVVAAIQEIHAPNVQSKISIPKGQMALIYLLLNKNTDLAGIDLGNGNGPWSNNHKWLLSYEFEALITV